MRQHMLLSILLMVVLTLLVFMGRHAAADAPNVNAMPSSDLRGVNDALASVEDAMRQTKEAEGPERRTKIATGPNANAMVTIDLIPNGGPGNQIDDGVTSGTVSGRGTKIAVEVFAKGVTTSLVGLQIKFDFDASVLTFDYAENSAFTYFVPKATNANFAGTAPVTLPASGFIARAEFSTVVDVTGREFSIGIKAVTLSESSASFDVITTTDVIRFNAAPSPDAASSPDFDGDGVVGILDFLLFVDHFGTSRGDAGYDAKYDLDGNGAIGIPDFLIFVDSFGKPAPLAIPDANLRAAIETALGKASGASITRAEMATLTRLDAPNKGIRSLTGLEHATNLQRLDLGGDQLVDGRLVNSNDISDLSPLSNLTNLTYLDLYNNSISDISPLSGLTNLTSLDLWNNSISDISPLVANTGLGSGDRVGLVSNPLSATSINTHIPALQSRGVTVIFDRSSGGGSPDLIVESPSVSNNTLTTGESFTLSATVRNSGAGASASTTLRYYQSSDATISTSDTEVGTDSVNGLSASGSSSESIGLTAPSTGGTYYYGACVESVSGESDTSNNCSPGVRVTVGSPGFTLSGTVSDRRRNGQLIAGAIVEISNGKQESMTTDPDGRYHFLNVSGTFTVKAIAEPNYLADTVQITMDADHTIDFALEHTGIPPFYGTVWVTPNLIDPSDPTSFLGVTFVGRGMRLFWDRPAEMWTTVNTYLFNVQIAGRILEFQVHPEFGSKEAAQSEVATYAPSLGRLPAVLLSGVKEVEISASNNVFQGNSQEGIIHIYSGYGKELIGNGFLEEVFIHEGGHASLDDVHAGSTGWRAAQEADGVFISTYAQDHPQGEDVAESILLYFALRYRSERLTDADRAAIVATIPNRLVYFDQQGFDMSPYGAAK